MFPQIDTTRSVFPNKDQIKDLPYSTVSAGDIACRFPCEVIYQVLGATRARVTNSITSVSGNVYLFMNRSQKLLI